MIQLAHKLRVTDYFSLGWGTMVGVGWLVVMDDWLLRGGALGGIFGFAIGGILLLPIGYVYGKLVMAMPDAAGEVAYTARVFPRPISFYTGWMMLLAYFIVCPWEAVAVGRIAGYIFPTLDSIELYRVAGKPVYLPHLVIGLALTALVTVVNYRGIRLSATFQNWTTFGTLARALRSRKHRPSWKSPCIRSMHASRPTRMPWNVCCSQAGEPLSSSQRGNVPIVRSQ